MCLLWTGWKLRVMLVRSLKKRSRLVFIHTLCLCQRPSGLLMTVMDFFLPLLSQRAELRFWNAMKSWLKLSSSEYDTDVLKYCSKHFGLNFPSALPLKLVTIYHSKWVMPRDTFLDTKSWSTAPASTLELLWGIDYPEMVSSSSYDDSLGFQFWQCWSPSGCSQLRLS